MKHQIEAVYEVLERYMEGTYTADIPMLESVFHQEARMTGYLGDQLIMGTPAPFLEDMASQASMKEQGQEYRADIRNVEVNGNVASATVHERGFRGSAEWWIIFICFVKTGCGRSFPRHLPPFEGCP